MEELDFRNKVMLAPMVRVTTLPMRLLALDYGADIVFSEEIVDLRILKCKRVENDIIGSVDFVTSDEENPVLRIVPSKENSRLIFQVGTNSPGKAVSAAKLVEKDVSGFDVNMGCPKPFSVHSGMGAGLLKEPEKVEQILTALVQAVNIPISCKIRLLDKLEDTLKFCLMVERCGVRALTIHGRRKDERPHHPNRNDEIREISRALSIPVIANGGSKEIRTWNDIQTFKHQTGCSSVMLARAAQRNPSIFRREGALPLDLVIQDYLKYAADFDALPQNVKYVIQRMMGEEQTTTERGKKLLDSVTLRQMCSLWDLEKYYVKTRSKQRDRRGRSLASGEHEILSNPCLIEMDLAVPKKNFEKLSPKFVLSNWCKIHKIGNPTYQTVHRTSDRRFRSVLSLDGKQFSSSFWERNKKFSEQASAMVALNYLGLRYLLSDDFWDEDYRPS